MQDWSGEVAVVTGGASGLGAACAKQLTTKGMRIAVFDLNEEQGEQQAAELGGIFCKTDVSDSANVAASLTSVVDQLGSPRVVINCAGIGGSAKTVSRGAAHDPEKFEKTIKVNLIGTFNVASQAAALMVAADPIGADGARGVMVNTASVAAFEGQVGQLAYSASKGGIVAMTLPMARDLADKGIRVCTVAPGLFSTPLMDELPQEVQDSLGAQVPFPSRLGQAEEYANMVGHIVENTMLNGEVIRLDGAIRMAPR